MTMYIVNDCYYIVFIVVMVYQDHKVIVRMSANTYSYIYLRFKCAPKWNKVENDVKMVH